MFDLLTGMTVPEQLQPQQEMPATDLQDLALRLLAQGRQCGQRRTLVIAGKSDWCLQAAHLISELPELKRVIWVSTATLDDVEVVPANKAKSLLGQECHAVVFDAYSGFDPDAFGAICGTICAGGILVLLCPPLSEWEYFSDPASERIATSPYGYQDISGRFIRRLVGVIRDGTGVAIVEQNKPLSVIEPDSQIPVSDEAIKKESPGECRTRDQQTAVDAIEHMARGHRRRPAVLVSDRGRGKSAALGIAAAHLLKNAESRKDRLSSPIQIVVTAPNLRAVEAVFSHAKNILQQSLAEVTAIENGIQFKQSSIRYVAPDALCLMQDSVDLVLVDEAAAIPASMLEQFLEKYSRIAFATTVHGYEGTGRGFAVRFRQTLNLKSPGWAEVKLQTPIRWAENDPLEQLVFRSLLLDAECANDEKVMGVDLDNVIIEKLDREMLVNDEQLLAQLFGLLVAAHYRTTPNDLRNLLDGPAVSIYVMRSFSPSNGQGEGKCQVIATALVSTEGDFTDELADAIYAGKRRPRGHLIPQSLVTHLGIREAARLRVARIMRIAVHPVLQRKGLGSKLVQVIRQEAKENNDHLIGVSFGATSELMHFWEMQGMTPVRVGFRRDHASGEHSVMMLAPLNIQGDEVYQTARFRLVADLPFWLSDSLCDLDYTVVMKLLLGEGAEDQVVTGEIDYRALIAFAEGARSYEDCSADIWRLSVRGLMEYGNRLQRVEQILLVARILQKQSWSRVAILSGLNGRTDVVNGIRSAVSILLNYMKGKF